MLYFNVISLLLIIGGAVLLGLQTPEIAPMARVYPLVLIVLVGACSLAVIVKEFAGRASTAPLDKGIAQVIFAPTRFRYRLFAFAAVWLVYPWALSALGFIIATTVALSISLWLLKVKRIFVAIASAAAFSVAFSVLFATVLYIPTPAGPLDQLLAEALYALQH